MSFSCLNIEKNTQKEGIGGSIVCIRLHKAINPLAQISICIFYLIVLN